MYLSSVPGFRTYLLGTALLCSPLLKAQSGGQVHGNFSMDGQLYKDDEQIGAVKPPADFGLNSWTNLNYRNAAGNFDAGIRFESYEPALLGYPAGAAYKGSGIGYRFATFRTDGLEITAGNFYEQFGQGLAFRSYEERSLGVDNAMDGVRVKFNPDTGIYLKGIIGTQRLAFDKGTTQGIGIVRGIDGEISLVEAFPTAFPKLAERGNNLTIGGSFVSKFQPDQDPLLELPENVGLWAARAHYTNAKWDLYSEYEYDQRPQRQQQQHLQAGAGADGKCLVQHQGPGHQRGRAHLRQHGVPERSRRTHVVRPQHQLPAHAGQTAYL
jgi:hypothetical protein